MPENHLRAPFPCQCILTSEKLSWLHKSVVIMLFSMLTALDVILIAWQTPVSV